MADNVSTTKLTLDISDFKKNIQDAKKQIQLANAEFKSASAGMENWADSVEGVSAKIKQLKSNLDSQKAILESYRAQLEKLVQEEGESAKGADDLRIKIYNQEATVKNTEKELEKYNDRLGELENASDGAEDATDDLGESIDDLDPEGAANGFTVLKGAIADLVADGIRMAISAIKDFVAQTIEVGREFDTSMSKVGALSGATAEELQMLRDTAKEFGSSTIFSASESADALGYMALAGWDAQQSADALGGVLNLAAASGMDLAEASDLCTDYMSAFGWEASRASDFADILAYAQANANTTVEGLGEAFRNVSANMAAAGQDVETTTSLLSMMANQGLKGAKAGTALAAVLRDMTAKMESAEYNMVSFAKAAGDMGKDTHGLSDALEKVGVSGKEMNDALEESQGDLDAFMTALQASAKEGTNLEEVFNSAGYTMTDFGTIFDSLNANQKNYTITIGETEVAVTDANGSFRDMTDILLDVEKATDGMEDAEKAVALSSTFTADSIKGLNLLLNAGVGEAAAFEEELRGAGGSAEEMAKVMNDNLGGDLTALKSQFEGVQIALYEKLEPALRSGVEVLSGLLDVLSWLVDHGEGVVGTITAIATATAAYIAYTTAIKVMKEGWMALEIVQKAVTAAQWLMNAAMAANPIGIIIALVAALVAAFIYFWNTSEEFRNFFITMWNAIKETVGAVIEFIWNLIKDFVKGYIEDWKMLFKTAKDVWEGIKKAWSVVSSWFKNSVITPVSNFFSGMWSKLTEGAKKAWEGIKNAFASVATWFHDIFSTAWQKVKDVFSTGGAIFEGITDGIIDAFKKVVNAIIRGINNVIAIPFNAINGILENIKNVSIAGIKPFDKIISTLSVPQIPELAQGGVLAKGQMGLLEGDGAEAVVPLDQNQKWISATAKALKSALGSEGVVGSSSQTTYNFVQNNTSPKALSRLEIYRQTQNQLAFARGI